MGHGFPPDSPKRQVKEANDCCASHLVKWDCGCSWGCPLCWASWECSVCGHKMNDSGKALLEQGNK